MTHERDVCRRRRYRWLEDPHPWCISRQLWWGHRVPAWRIRVAGAESKAEEECDTDAEMMAQWVVGRNAEEAMQRAVEKTGKSAEEITLTQDDDVLDTWFSSGLFPFSVFGWPAAPEPIRTSATSGPLSVLVLARLLCCGCSCLVVFLPGSCRALGLRSPTPWSSSSSWLHTTILV